MRVRWLALVGVAAGLAAPAPAGAATVFRFDRTSAAPNDRVAIHAVRRVRSSPRGCISSAATWRTTCTRALTRA